MQQLEEDLAHFPITTTVLPAFGSNPHPYHVVRILHGANSIPDRAEQDLIHRESRSAQCLTNKRHCTLLHMRAIQGHFGGNRVVPSLFDSVKVPFTWSEHIYHVGCALGMHSITHSGLVARGKDTIEKRQTVFFTAVNPMTDPQEDAPYEWRNDERCNTSLMTLQHSLVLKKKWIPKLKNFLYQKASSSPRRSQNCSEGCLASSTRKTSSAWNK